MFRTAARWFVPALAAAQILPVLAGRDWQLYQFREREQFRYELSWTQRGQTSTGHYALKIRPAADGRLLIEVDGKLGESECKAEVTVESADAVPQQMMMNCMMLTPAMIVLFGPASGYYVGRELNEGDSWSFTHGGESMSFDVEGGCRYAGQEGKLTVMRHNGEVRMESCVSPEMALPLAVTLNEENGDSVEAKLVKYAR